VHAREEDAESGETEAALCMLGRVAVAEDADATVRKIGEIVGEVRFGEEWSRDALRPVLYKSVS
jgi:hypothetical protein